MTIKEAVDEILRSRPYLEEALQDGLINITSLARKLMKEVALKTGKDPALGAVVMAIQRHQPGKLTMINLKAGSLMSNITNIIVRSGIIVQTYENSASLPDRLTELSIMFSKKKRVFYTFSQGIFETTIIFGKRVLDELNNIMTEENKISEAKDQSCLTLYLPDENTSIPGYYYYILKLIAWEGINITEILSTTNEFSIILHDGLIDRAFSVLKSTGKG
jgi:hypothetical protein